MVPLSRNAHRSEKRKVREREFQVGLGSDAQVLEADAASGLANPSREHLSYLSLRTPGMPLFSHRLWEEDL